MSLRLPFPSYKKNANIQTLLAHMKATLGIGVLKMIIIGWNVGVQTAENSGGLIVKTENIESLTKRSTEKSTKNTVDFCSQKRIIAISTNERVICIDDTLM